MIMINPRISGFPAKLSDKPICLSLFIMFSSQIQMMSMFLLRFWPSISASFIGTSDVNDLLSTAWEGPGALCFGLLRLQGGAGALTKTYTAGSTDWQYGWMFLTSNTIKYLGSRDFLWFWHCSIPKHPIFAIAIPTCAAVRLDHRRFPESGVPPNHQF